MLRAAKKVLVTLTPARLEATLMRGDKIIASSARDLDPKRWDPLWAEGLHALDNPLAELLRSLRAGRCETHVLYHGRETQCDVASFPMGQEEAVGAAQLAQAAEVAGTRQGLCQVLWVENSPSLKSNILVASDRNETLSVLGAWVRRAGGTPASCLPMCVPQVAESVRTLTGAPSDRPLCRVLVGEHATVLAGSVEGKIAFVRSVDMGFSLLVSAIVAATAESETPMSYTAARQHVLQHGLPSHNSQSARGVAMDRVMSLVFPILQRYVVECRQTLRFGFGTDQSRVKVELVGPGAAIEGLAQSLSAQLECDVSPAGSPGEVELSSALKLVAASGFLADYERDERRLKRINSGIGVGLGLSILILGGQFISLHQKRRAVNIAMAAQAAQVAHASQELQVRRSASKVATELARLQEVVGFAEREKIDLYAVLAELSRLTPPNVHIEESNYSVMDSSSVLSLRGAVSFRDSGEIDPLSEFLTVLREDPIVAAVELGSTRVVDDHGIRTKEFSLTLRLKRPARIANGETP